MDCGDPAAGPGAAVPEQRAGTAVQLALGEDEAERVGQPVDDVPHQADAPRFLHRVPGQAADRGDGLGGVQAVRGPADQVRSGLV